MRWCVCDTSPSAVQRGRSNEPILCDPSEVHKHVDQGTVWLYFFDTDDDTDFPNPEKHHFIAGVQFWQGWLNQIAGGTSDDPKVPVSVIGQAVQEAFGKYKGGSMTQEQIVAAFAEMEAVLV